MKIKSIPTSLALLALAGGQLTQANESFATPIGSLDALQKHVLVGDTVDLDWKISYPVHNFNETDSKVRVQFITLATGPNNTVSFGTRITGQSFREFYNGVSEEHPNYALTPGTNVSQDILEHGLTIEFLAKHSRSQVPGAWVSSENPAHAHQIIELVHGDPIPKVTPVQGQRSVAEILAPYNENGTVSIGHNQKILLFEIFTSDVNHFGFDLQDLVLLVSHEQLALHEIK